MNSINLHSQEFLIQRFDDDFILLKNEVSPHVFQIGQAIFNEQYEFIDEVIATETEICLKLNHHFNNNSLKHLQSIKKAVENKSISYQIPVCFHESGDWNLVEQHTNQSREKVIEKLLELEFTVAMFGFLPGFVYMNGLPNQYHVPRKETPSVKMSPNTLAIGGPYLGIYNHASPGGWNSIGEIGCSIFDKEQSSPLLIQQTDRFRFKAVSHEEYVELKNHNLSIIQYNEIG